MPVNSSQRRQTVRSTRHAIFRCDELTGSHFGIDYIWYLCVVLFVCDQYSVKTADGSRVTPRRNYNGKDFFSICEATNKELEC